MINSRQLFMPLNADFFAGYPGAETFFNFGLRSLILGDCRANIFQCLFACGALAVAARKVITPNGEALLGFYKRHVIGHYQKLQHLKQVRKNIRAGSLEESAFQFGRLPNSCST